MLAGVPIHSQSHGAVQVLTIDRTHRRNALDHVALEELHAAVTSAVDSGARAIVLTGAEGHFCAGADLTELEDVSFTRRLAQVLVHLATVPVTTIAAVSGSCMGLGMQLALACDVRVVADDARFAVPVAKLGLMVDRWTVDRLVCHWGEGAARHMVLTAAVLDADDAYRYGFTQERGELGTAVELARRAEGLAPLTQVGSKLGLEPAPVADPAYDEAFARAWASQDLAEGQRAFRERRSPVFEGR